MTVWLFVQVDDPGDGELDDLAARLAAEARAKQASAIRATVERQGWEDDDE